MYYKFNEMCLSGYFFPFQAHGPKIIITDINNRYVDNSTKKEVWLNLNFI